MRRVATVSILFLLSVLSIAAQQTPNGVIEGVVVDAGTGQPISGAQVNLTPLGNLTAAPGNVAGGNPGAIAPAPPPSPPPPPPPPPAAAPAGGAVGGAVGGGAGAGFVFTQSVPAGGLADLVQRPGAIPPVTTDSDGKFSFRQLNAGTFRVVAVANGYVRQEYGQKAVNGQGKLIYLAAGEIFKDASIRLIPTGILSGRVFDDNGQPAIGAPVQALRAVYNAQGKNYQSAGSTNADDRGQYRLYGLPPGRYYLAAGNPPGPNRPAALGGAPVGTSRYEYLFYPAASDIEQAVAIEVKSGSEMTQDMRVKRQAQTFSVRGRIIDTATGAPPPRAQVSLGYRNLGSSGSFSQGQNYNPTTGAFELLNIAPGNYTVQATFQGQTTPLVGPVDTATIDARRAEQAAWPSAQVAIRVTDSNVEGLQLALSPGVKLAGKVTLEGQPLSSIANLDRFRLNISPLIPAPNASAVAMAPNADGSFDIYGVREGEYRITALMPAAGLYVKSIQYGGDDILTKPFKFSGAASGTVDVTLRAGTAQLSGVVSNAQSQPIAGVQVVLIPVQQSRPDAFRVGTTDPTGRFSMANIPPGDYRVFSWESIDTGAYYDPEFVKPYEQWGVSVHLAESANQTVDVKLIPAP